MRVRLLSWEDPLEEGMATHSSILAWRILSTEQPDKRLEPRMLQRTLNCRGPAGMTDSLNKYLMSAHYTRHCNWSEDTGVNKQTGPRSGPQRLTL